MEGEMQRRVYHVRAAEKVDGEWKMVHEGGATVLLERKGEDDWIASVVICSPLDTFCKRTGLRIAEVRMRSYRAGKTVRNVVETPTTQTRDAVRYAIHDVLSRYPNRGHKNDVATWTLSHVLYPMEEIKNA